jgi:hypothetical protein
LRAMAGEMQGGARLLQRWNSPFGAVAGGVHGCWRNQGAIHGKKEELAPMEWESWATLKFLRAGEDSKGEELAARKGWRPWEGRSRAPCAGEEGEVAMAGRSCFLRCRGENREEETVGEKMEDVVGVGVGVHGRSSVGEGDGRERR